MLTPLTAEKLTVQINKMRYYAKGGRANLRWWKHMHHNSVKAWQREKTSIIAYKKYKNG